MYIYFVFYSETTVGAVYLEQTEFYCTYNLIYRTYATLLTF